MSEESSRLKIVMPEYVAYYTNTRIPTDISNEAIDEWLAALPDVLDFWESQAAERRFAYEMQEVLVKQTAAKAYNEADSSLSVKSRENLAACDERVYEAAQKALTMRCEMDLVKAKMAMMEAKLKAVHKIATLRVRRLEQGITAPTVSSKTMQRSERNGNSKVVWNSPKSDINPPPQPSGVVPAKEKDAIDDELDQELTKELFTEEKEVW